MLSAQQNDPFKSIRHYLPLKLFSEKGLSSTDSFEDLLFSEEQKPNRYNSEVNIRIVLYSQISFEFDMGRVELILPKFENEKNKEEIESDLEEITRSWRENGRKSTKLKYQIKSSGLKLE